MTYKYKYNLTSEGANSIQSISILIGEHWIDWCYLDECPLPEEEFVIRWWN